MVGYEDYEMVENRSIWQVTLLGVVAIVAIVVLVSQSTPLSERNDGTGYVSQYSSQGSNPVTGYVPANRNSGAFEKKMPQIPRLPLPPLKRFSTQSTKPATKPAVAPADRWGCVNAQKCPSMRFLQTQGKTLADAKNNKIAEQCYTRCKIDYGCFVNTIWTQQCFRSDASYRQCAMKTAKDMKKCVGRR